MSRTKSSDAWLRRHVGDEFVKRARQEGWRSRAAFKLAEIDKRDRLLRPGMMVVDLGAAPGGWSQYAQRRLAPDGRLLAVDILPMEPLPGVEVIRGDFSDATVLNLLNGRIGGRPVDLVMSDMAPNITGIAVADQARSQGLAELALAFALEVLRPGGMLLLKAFQGEGYQDLRREMQQRFDTVVSRKPKASRADSREMYLVGKVFKRP